MKEYTPGEEAKITNNYNAYNKGFEAGKIHSQPSSITVEFMKNITDQITELKADLKEKLENMPTNDGMKLFVKDIVSQAVEACGNRFADKRLEEEVKDLDCKFASKEIEKTIKTISNILLTATIGGAIALTYKIIEYFFKF